MEAPFQDDEFTTKSNPFQRHSSSVNMRYQQLMDMVVPYVAPRWIFFVALLLGYIVRTVLLQGWYVITYALGIFLLHLLLAFLTPNQDPSVLNGDDGDDDIGPSLPTKANDEFKPFIRKLPEFKAWQSGTKATLIALFCTFFDFFNIPVFWPILVLYFLSLVAITMKRQIKHMIKYKYVPFSVGKKKFGADKAGKASSY